VQAAIKEILVDYGPQTAVSQTAGKRLHCVVVSAVFPPEFTFSGRISQQVAQGLADEGHQVTVLAPFPNRPAGHLFPGYTRTLYRRTAMSAGYELVHCFSTLAPNSHMVPRLIENLTFGLTSAWQLLTVKRPDVIYSNSWPIFASGIMAAVAYVRRIPFVVSVQDVYPESLVAQGRACQVGRTLRLLRSIDRWIAGHAAGLIVISEGFRRFYVGSRGVPSSRVHLVYNWGEQAEEDPDPRASAAFRAAKAIPPDAFLAVYGGNIGPASGAQGIVEAFAQLKESPVYLLIAGSGSCLDACRDRAHRLANHRVIFHSPWRQEETAAVLGAADVVLLPTVGCQALVSMPSKLISYMLRGKPVIAQIHGESDTALMLDKAGAGWVLPPDRPDLLAAAIRQVAALDGETLARKGQDGKRYALENLCRELNLPKVLNILRSAALTAGRR
jgi:glycosyltransferase involved in cell wall biosynthesis